MILRIEAGRRYRQALQDMIRVRHLIDGEIGDTACFLGHNRDRRRKRTAGIRADKT
jgi:hypothetical protein